ncbi:MAG: glycosyltransferase family 2 protein [Acidimicrobiales bacterium]
MIYISVVVLNYNYARFLPTAINSALTQTHSAVEVIVVDDASTDDSLAVIEGFGDSITPVLHERNLGQGAAINSGAAAATGDVVWFLDADDALLPEACATAVAAFEADQRLSKFHTPLAVIDGKGRWNGTTLPANPQRLAVGDMSEHVLKFRAHGWPPMSGNAYSAGALSRVLPVPAESYRQAADSFLNEQTAICGPMARSDLPVAAYRRHGANQFADQPITLEWLRTKIDRELCSHEHLGLVAWQLLLTDYRHNQDDVMDVAFLGYRLASLRLDPQGHGEIPSVGADTRIGLAENGIRAAFRNPQLAWSDRVLRTLWFAAVAAVPRVGVVPLLGWYLPDGPSQPIWRRIGPRAKDRGTRWTLLVQPADPPGGSEDEMDMNSEKSERNGEHDGRTG